jgi:hypothetical protein
MLLVNRRKQFLSKYYINISCRAIHGQVGKEFEFKPLALHSFGFKSCQGSWILSCEEGVQLASGTLVVLLRCQLESEINFDHTPSVKLGCCHKTFTVLVIRCKLKPKIFICDPSMAWIHVSRAERWTPYSTTRSVLRINWHIDVFQEIIPFIEKHWENMTTMPRRVKLTWHNTVHKTLVYIIHYIIWMFTILHI